MATVAYLTDNHTAEPGENPRAFGAITDGWVVKNNSVLISDVTSTIADGPHNAFNHASTSGYDVTIDTGEAMVSGSPIGKDAQTTVTLASSTNGQTVYVGSEPQTQDSVVVGLDADFTSSAIRIPIWEFDTGSSTVTASTDLRDLGSYVNVPNRRYERSDGSGVAVDNASQLGGVYANNYARTDQSTTFDANVSMGGNRIESARFVSSAANSNGLNLDPGGQADVALQSISSDGYVQMWDAYNGQVVGEFHVGGAVKFPNGDLETRRGWMVDHSSPITIEKDGTDGQGVINFKTSN